MYLYDHNNKSYAIRCLSFVRKGQRRGKIGYFVGCFAAVTAGATSGENAVRNRRAAGEIDVGAEAYSVTPCCIKPSINVPSARLTCPVCSFTASPPSVIAAVGMPNLVEITPEESSPVHRMAACLRVRNVSAACPADRAAHCLRSRCTASSSLRVLRGKP